MNEQTKKRWKPLDKWCERSWVGVSQILRTCEDSQQNQISERRARPPLWSPQLPFQCRNLPTPPSGKDLGDPPADFQASEAQNFSSLFCWWTAQIVRKFFLFVSLTSTHDVSSASVAALQVCFLPHVNMCSSLKNLSFLSLHYFGCLSSSYQYWADCGSDAEKRTLQWLFFWSLQHCYSKGAIIVLLQIRLRIFIFNFL